MTSSLSVAWGGASVIGGGGLMSNATGAHDPVGDYADTSPAELGRKVMKSAHPLPWASANASVAGPGGTVVDGKARRGIAPVAD